METIFDFFARRSSFSVQCKRNFQRMLHARYWKQIFSEVQTISFFPVQWKRIFLTKPSFQLLEEGFLFIGNRLLYLRDLSNLANELVETIFFHWLRYFSRSSSSRLVETHFLVQKKKYCFFLRTFFPASGNHYLNYREAYLKLLSLYWE